jgi:glycosyltransferase involved in cell wall biosynthesis
MKHKLIRITTISSSIHKLLENQIPYMKNHYDVIAIASPDSLLNDIAKFNSIRVHPVVMTRKITPLRDLRAFFALYFFFKTEKPLFVHTHTPKAGTLGMLAAKMAGIPLRLHTVAGLPLLEAKGFKKILLIIVEMITYNCATNIYPNSFGLKNIIISKNLCKKNKLKVLANGSSNGIDLRHFDPIHFSEYEKKILRTSLKIRENDFVYIFVGRLVGDKGLNELVEAFEFLCLKHSNIKLLLVGEFECDLDPLSPKTINQISFNANIIHVGFQKDVRIYYLISQCLVFPSYREGFPNVVMQAGAMSLPSIVTNINGCNEIIQNRINGLLIPVKNTMQLIKNMEELLIDNKLYEILKNNARRMIFSRFDQKFVHEALLNEYKFLQNKVNII